MKNNKNTKQKTKNKKHSVLKLCLLIILIIILLIALYFTYGTMKNGGGIKGLVTTALGQTQEEIENLEPISALILGSSQNLTDTIMVFKYNPKTQKAYLVSIPRDTFTGTSKDSATASQKINSIYQGTHPEKTLAAVNKITNLNLKYYVVVDTEALKALVDTIGGVYFDVPIDMKYTDKKQNLYIDLKQGYQLLDGDKAEQVVRFRHNQDGTTYSSEYGDNDIGRMKTQRNFLKSVVKQTLTVGNITKIGNFIDIAQTYVKTNMDMSIIKQYIAPALNFNIDNLETGTLPGAPEKCNKVWLYICNQTKTKQFFTILDRNILSANNISSEEISNTKIEILNGSGKKANLSRVIKILKDAGFTVTKSSSTNSTIKTSIINKKEVSDDIVEYIKSLIGDSSVSSSNSQGNVYLTIILGKDFK